MKLIYNNYMVLDYRWLGIISMIIFVLAAGVPLLGGPLDWQDSVSHSWTKSQHKWLLFGVLMSLAVTGACISLVLWLIPHYHLPSLTYGVIALVYVASFAVIWIPMTDRPGQHSYWHGHFLGGGGLCTLAVIAMAIVLWFGINVSNVARIACFVAMIFAVSWPLLFFSPARRMFLVLESLIAVTIWAAIMLLLVG